VDLKKINASLIHEGSLPFVIDPIIVVNGKEERKTTTITADQLSCIQSQIEAFRFAERENAIDKATGKKILNFIQSGPIHILLTDTNRAINFDRSPVYLNAFGSDFLREHGDEYQKNITTHESALVAIQLAVNPNSHRTECIKYEPETLNDFIKTSWLAPMVEDYDPNKFMHEHSDNISAIFDASEASKNPDVPVFNAAQPNTIKAVAAE
jgi:hypothetical protein